MEPRSQPRTPRLRAGRHFWDLMPHTGEERLHAFMLLAPPERLTMWQVQRGWMTTIEIKQQEGLSIASSKMPEALHELAARVNSLASQVNALQEQIQRLCAVLGEKPTIKQTTILDLNSDKYALKSPVQIEVEEYAEEAVATFEELDLFGTGNTVGEAVADLKNQIIDLYEDLAHLDPASLGRLPLAWKRILSRFVKVSA